MARARPCLTPSWSHRPIALLWASPYPSIKPMSIVLRRSPFWFNRFKPSFRSKSGHEEDWCGDVFASGVWNAIMTYKSMEMMIMYEHQRWVAFATALIIYSRQMLLERTTKRKPVMHMQWRLMPSWATIKARTRSPKPFVVCDWKRTRANIKHHQARYITRS